MENILQVTSSINCATEQHEQRILHRTQPTEKHLCQRDALTSAILNRRYYSFSCVRSFHVSTNLIYTFLLVDENNARKAACQSKDEFGPRQLGRHLYKHCNYLFYFPSLVPCIYVGRLPH